MALLKNLQSSKTNERLPYRLRGHLLSTTELVLYRALLVMAENRYVVCPKVALNDIFLIVRPNENVHYFNKIFRKHVDFLLCDQHSLKPAFGVEVIKPISRSELRAADQFIEEIFLGAGLPLVHVPSAQQYEISDLISLFQIAVTKARSAPTADSGTDSVPDCPVCGKMMVLRIHRSGSNKGRMYYGCIDSPRCPGVVQIKG